MFDVDESAWPIVAVTWHGSVDDAELERLLGWVDQWFARGERFGLLLDLRRGIGDMSSDQRALVVRHMRATAEKSGAGMVQAIVYDHPLHRAMYEVMSRIFPLPFPSKTFPEPESARVWLADKLRSVTAGGRAR